MAEVLTAPKEQRINGKVTHTNDLRP